MRAPGSRTALDVWIVGQGQVAVTRGEAPSERNMAADALRAALADAGFDGVDAVVVGNMTGGELSRQRQLGVGVVTDLGLEGIEVLRVEVASASGAGALRAGVLAVASGLCRRVAVVGVERMTHVAFDAITGALGTAADAETEAGETFLRLNALLMREYAARWGVPDDGLWDFAQLAHANAARNPNACFPRLLTRDEYVQSRVVAPPIRLYDASPLCDGAAAVVLTAGADAPAGRPRVRVAGSAVTTDALAVTRRPDPTALRAAGTSMAAALAQAGCSHADVDFVEAHDAYTIMAALSLEAAGFARPGEAWRDAAAGRFDRDGELPIATMGGLKARGHPVGATGVYQAAECFLQLTGQAGACQVARARRGAAANLGGAAATVISHVFEAP
jgi:acetyl-CoA C-acetyltransferase